MSGEAYHLIPLGALILFFYALSLLLVHFSLIPKQQNRRFWNFLLLIFFVSTAPLGLILVVKVNYKLDLPWVEEAMQWQVDGGMGFALVAVFHLLWNLRYYTRRQDQVSRKITGPAAADQSPLSFTATQQRVFFLLLGYICMMAQLVLLREYIKSFHGNELVIGIFLAIWMILTAMGARSGNNYPVSLAPRGIFRLLVFLGAFPLLIHILLILQKRFFFLPGYQAGILEMTISMLILTALFTGASGFLFGNVSKSVEALSSRSSAYRLDSLGSLAAGALFSLIFVHLFNNLQQLTLLLVSTLLLVRLVYRYPEQSINRWILPMTGAIFFVLSLIPGAVNKVEELGYRQEKVLQIRDTPFGNLTFTSRNNQVTGYMDGNPVLSASDVTRAEESVHFAALQHPDPRSFLLMGGGLTGQIDEVSKYEPERIDYCEADPWIYRMGQIYFPGTRAESLHVIPKDGRSWLMRSGEGQYDVIISTASDPVTIGWNRFFTLEFYNLVKRHLSPDGVFCMKLSTGGNYVNNEGTALLGINYHTLRQVFTNVALVPGTSTYFIASDSPLSLDYPALLLEHQIPTTYVHPDYLDAMQLLFDSEQLSERVQAEEPVINRDLRPTLFFASLTGLQSRMGPHALGISGILASALLIFLWFLYSPIKSAMYVSGFSGAGIQMVLIMVMQSFYGFAYLVAPLMITIFMGGIVLGTWEWKGKLPLSPKARLTGLLGLLVLVSLLGILLLRAQAPFQSGWPGQVLLGILNLITGILVGAVFAVAVNLDGKASNPGILYSADLTGAALGTLLPLVFLLPLIGVLNTFILFGGINALTALRLMLNVQKRSNG